MSGVRASTRRRCSSGSEQRISTSRAGVSARCATARQEALPLTAVVVDDGGYGMLRYDQTKAGEETYGVDLHTPDFEALAASFGVRAETVEGLDDEFGEALARHVADPARPAAQHLAELVPPPNLKGSDPFMLRRVARRALAENRRG